MKVLMLTGLILALSFLNGCATVTTGSNQNVTVETEPSGANCKMTRDDETIGIVNPTPGSITIGKDKDQIDVSCELSGYLTTAYSLDSTFQGATLGNILLGGIIGIAIDAGSGAMNEYPASIFVRLQPEAFVDEQERDAYFDTLITELNDNTDRIAQGKKYSCNTKTCEKKLEALYDQRDAELAEIESARTDASLSRD